MTSERGPPRRIYERSEGSRRLRGGKMENIADAIREDRPPAGEMFDLAGE
jgi:hypothetical protein